MAIIFYNYHSIIINIISNYKNIYILIYKLKCKNKFLVLELFKALE
jgi:hypothetical protein